MINSYVAIGDSFTEGLGDPRADGTLRGWADRLAEGLAVAQTEAGNTVPFRYANLAIRGRRLEPLLAEQLEQAIALKPDLISLNGGGNDMLRPNFSLEHSVTILREAVDKMRRNNIHVLLLAGADPSEHLPMGKLFSARSTAFTQVTEAWAGPMGGLTYCDNFNDRSLAAAKFWSDDGLHLAPAGHLRVAINCLDSLGVPHPQNWSVDDLTDDSERDFGSSHYYQQFVLPWIGRRIRRESSGDGRAPKRPELSEFSA